MYVFFMYLFVLLYTHILIINNNNNNSILSYNDPNRRSVNEKKLKS